MAIDIERVRLLRGDGASRRCDSAALKRRLRLALYALLGAAAIGTVVAVMPLKELLVAVSAWIDVHQIGGTLLLPLLFSVAIPLGIPATMLELASGSIFGFVKGAAMAAIGKTCGSLVGFFLGKRLGRERLGTYLETKFPVFTALSRVVEGPNWKPLVLLQLSSLPPFVKCYGLSITNIGVVRFTATTFIGGLPSAFLWASIGHQTKTALADDTGSQSGSRWTVLLFGLLCTALAMGLLFVYTRRELRAQLHHAPVPNKTRSTGDMTMQDPVDKELEDAEDTTSEATSEGTDDEDVCEVVITQIAVADTLAAKRVSVG